MLMKYVLSECYLILEICHFFFLVYFPSSEMAELKKKTGETFSVYHKCRVLNPNCMDTTIRPCF